MTKAPHTVTIVWGDGFTRDYPHKTAAEADEFVRNGISWTNPGIRLARIYGDNGEPARLEDAVSILRRHGAL